MFICFYVNCIGWGALLVARCGAPEPSFVVALEPMMSLQTSKCSTNERCSYRASRLLARRTPRRIVKGCKRVTNDLLPLPRHFWNFGENTTIVRIVDLDSKASQAVRVYPHSTATDRCKLL